MQGKTEHLFDMQVRLLNKIWTFQMLRISPVDNHGYGFSERINLGKGVDPPLSPIMGYFLKTNTLLKIETFPNRNDIIWIEGPFPNSLNSESDIQLQCLWK